MKLERLHEYIIPTVATVAGMIFAVKMGSLTGTGSLGAMSLILMAVACVTVCIWLRTKTWILVALAWDMTGSIPLTNLPLGVRDIIIILVAGSYGIFYALKMLRVRAGVDWIDFLIWATVLYLLTVFIRNPVGLNTFGSSRVGGRPYFDVVIALTAYFVLSKAPIDAVTLKRLPLYLLAGTGITSVGSLGTYLFPGSEAILGQIYSGFISSDTALQASDPTSRKQGLSLGGNTGMRVLCSYFPPSTLISPFYFWRFCAAMLCIVGVLLSGFRSSFITVVMYGVVSSFFRRRIQDVINFSLVGLLAVVVLAVGNGRIFTLPLAVQRVLTLFPGNWDSAAVDDANASTQWRLDMWKIVLLEDRYIKDRVLGDGYGFTRSELAIMESEARGGTGFVGGARQESFMISGMYHSGPLSTIRYAGYIGLAIYTALILLLAVRGWRLIRSAEDTPFFAAALFVGMPAVISPIIFYVIAGAFNYNLPDSIFLAGILKVVERGVFNARRLGVESTLENTRPRHSTPRLQVPRPVVHF